MKKIILIASLLLLTSCVINEEQYETDFTICIKDDIYFDSWNSLSQIQSKIDIDYKGQNCRVGSNGRKDIISCLGDRFYSIECK